MPRAKIKKPESVDMVISEVDSVTKKKAPIARRYRQKAAIAAYFIIEGSGAPNTNTALAKLILEGVYDVDKKVGETVKVQLDRYLGTSRNVKHIGKEDSHIDPEVIDERMLSILKSRCQAKKELSKLWKNNSNEIHIFAELLASLIDFKRKPARQTGLRNKIDEQLHTLQFAGANDKANKLEQKIENHLFPDKPENGTRILGIEGSRCTGKSNLVGTFIRNRRGKKRNGERHFRHKNLKNEIPVFFRSCHNKGFPEIVEDVAEFFLQSTPPVDTDECLGLIEEHSKKHPALLVFSQIDTHHFNHMTVRMRQGGLRRLFEILDKSHPDSRVIYTATDGVLDYLGKTIFKLEKVGMEKQIVSDLQYFVEDKLYENLVKKLSRQSKDNVKLDDEVSGETLTIMAALLTLDGGASGVVNFLIECATAQIDISRSFEKNEDRAAQLNRLLWTKFKDKIDIGDIPGKTFFQIFRYLAIAEDGIDFSTLEYLLEQYPTEGGLRNSKTTDVTIALMENFAMHSKNMISVVASRKPVEMNEKTFLNHQKHNSKYIGKTLFLDRNVARSYLAFAFNDKDLSKELRNDFLKIAKLARGNSQSIRLSRGSDFGNSKYDLRYDIQNYYFLLNSLDPEALVEASPLKKVTEHDIYNINRGDISKERFYFAFKRLLMGEMDRSAKLGRRLDQNKLKLDIYKHLYLYPPNPFIGKSDPDFTKTPAHWKAILKPRELAKAMLSLTRGAYFAGRYDACEALQTNIMSLLAKSENSHCPDFIRDCVRAQIYNLDASIRLGKNVTTALNNAIYTLVELKNTVDKLPSSLKSRRGFKRKLIARIDCKFHWIIRLSETSDVKLRNQGYISTLIPAKKLAIEFGDAIGLRNRRILIATFLHELHPKKTDTSPDDQRLLRQKMEMMKIIEDLHSQNISLLDEIGGAERATVIMDTARINAKRALLELDKNKLAKPSDKDKNYRQPDHCFNLWRSALTHADKTIDRINIPGTPIVYETALATYHIQIYIDLYSFYREVSKQNEKRASTLSARTRAGISSKGIEELVSPRDLNRTLEKLVTNLQQSIIFERGQRNLYVKRYKLLIRECKKMSKLGHYNPRKVFALLPDISTNPT